MSLLSETKTLIENLEKIKENLGLNKNTPGGGLFNSLEVRKGSKELHPTDILLKSMVTKPKKYYFRISFLKSSIQFLDIKSILNLSLVNKEFSYFIKSIYFYKFMKNVKKSKSKKENNKIKNKDSPKSTISNRSNKSKESSESKAAGGLFGNFVGAMGALGSAFGLGYKQTNVKENKIDPKLLEDKINIYQSILMAKVKNIKISEEIKEMRENIDSLINERIMRKESNNMNNSSNANKNFHNILMDDEIENIKRDKIEKEYNELQEQVKAFKIEHDKLKAEIESLQNEEIEKEKIITSLNIYVKNNLKVEELKITPKENLKSFKHDEIDADISTLALLNSYNN